MRDTGIPIACSLPEKVSKRSAEFLLDTKVFRRLNMAHPKKQSLEEAFCGWFAELAPAFL